MRTILQLTNNKVTIMNLNNISLDELGEAAQCAARYDMQNAYIATNEGHCINLWQVPHQGPQRCLASIEITPSLTRESALFQLEAEVATWAATARDNWDECSIEVWEWVHGEAFDVLQNIDDLNGLCKILREKIDEWDSRLDTLQGELDDDGDDDGIARAKSIGEVRGEMKAVSCSLENREESLN